MTPAAIVAAAPDLKALERDFTLSEEADKDGQQWVKAVPKAEYAAWLAQQKAGVSPAAAAASTVEAEEIAPAADAAPAAAPASAG